MAGRLMKLAEAAALRVATRAQGAIVRRFESAGAASAATAMRFAPAGKGEAHAFDRMVRYGAIVAEKDGWWLDTRALAAFRKEELAQVLGAVAIAGLAAAAGIAMGR